MVPDVFSFSGRFVSPDNNPYLGVGEQKHRQREKVLQNHQGHAVLVPLLLALPEFHADVPRGVVGIHIRRMHLQPRQNRCRQRRDERNYPDDEYDELRLQPRHPGTQGVQNGNVPVYADGDEGVSTDEHRHYLSVRHDHAHDSTEGPVLEQQIRDESEWYAEARHQDVSDCEVDDEKVSDCPHPLVRQHDIANHDVAAYGQDRHRNVHDVHDGGHGGGNLERRVCVHCVECLRDVGVHGGRSFFRKHFFENLLGVRNVSFHYV